MPVIADHLTHEYESDTALRTIALRDVSFVIPDGQFIGLIGHTGSGKSTLVQVLDALIKPTKGTIYLDGEDIFEKGYDRKKLRRNVGMVFQYPEHQLFETNIFADVCYGPKNLGLEKKETELRAYEALHMVGIEDGLFYTSPFDLSGGQKRRVAIAGVLATKPKLLILDEPTAGLDPKGRDEILDLVSAIHKEQGITVILVSHSMEDVANYVERLLVMEKGAVMLDGAPREIFSHYKELEAVGLAAPEVNYFMRKLKAEGYPVADDVITVEEAKREILKVFGAR